jgi:hypothetical protein
MNFRSGKRHRDLWDDRNCPRCEVGNFGTMPFQKRTRGLPEIFLAELDLCLAICGFKDIASLKEAGSEEAPTFR